MARIRTRTLTALAVLGGILHVGVARAQQPKPAVAAQQPKPAVPAPQPKPAAKPAAPANIEKTIRTAFYALTMTTQTALLPAPPTPTTRIDRASGRRRRRIQAGTATSRRAAMSTTRIATTARARVGAHAGTQGV